MKNKFYSTIKEYYDYIFPLNPKQVDFVESEFADDSSQLIEIGCANGKLTNALSRYSIMGIDLEESFVQIASQRYPHIPFAECNMLELDSLDKVFDGIVCFGNTLVHLDMNDIGVFAKQCMHCLNVGGKLLIQILNYDYILDNRITSLPMIDNDHVRFERRYRYGSGLAFDTELTIQSTGETISNSIGLTPIRKDELVEILEETGFVNIRVYGSFERDVLSSESLPLVICCERT